MMNNTVLIGRIANDLELRGTENNRVVNFNLAVTRAGNKEETDFIPVVTFGKSAENLVKYQGKGSLIACSGYIRQENYEKDGEKRNSIRVVASRVQFLGTKADVKTETMENKLGKESDFQMINDDDIPF